ncbi:MAG: 50S ribosomal protein L25 [Bacteroidales bacterium]|nr:50S ribosomal protein L25 [Bacteroidales bacterium]
MGNKQSLKQIRRNEQVPCVIYGNNVENVNFALVVKELKKITHTPASYIIDIDVEGKVYQCVFHAIQYHPVTDEALHADFLAINPEKPVVIDVPVVIVGNSEGVKQGGKLMVSARKLKVSAPMENLPDTLEVDITTLGLGKTIVAGNLSYEGVNIVSPKATIVCAVKMTRAALGAAAAAKAGKK